MIRDDDEMRDKSSESKGQKKIGTKEDGDQNDAPTIIQLGRPDAKQNLRNEIKKLEKRRRRDRLTHEEMMILDAQILLLKATLQNRMIHLGKKSR